MYVSTGVNGTGNKERQKNANSPYVQYIQLEEDTAQETGTTGKRLLPACHLFSRKFTGQGINKTENDLRPCLLEV